MHFRSSQEPKRSSSLRRCWRGRCLKGFIGWVETTPLDEYIYIYICMYICVYMCIYIYICFSGNQSWLLHRSSLFMSPRAFLALAIEGVRSNFWGLGCPAYCASPSLGLLGFCLLLGWLLGLLSSVLLLVWISGPGAPLLDFLRCPVRTFRGSSQTSTDSRSQVLAAYVHEPGAHLPRRRRWIAHWPAW